MKPYRKRWPDGPFAGLGDIQRPMPILPAEPDRGGGALPTLLSMAVGVLVALAGTAAILSLAFLAARPAHQAPSAAETEVPLNP